MGAKKSKSASNSATNSNTNSNNNSKNSSINGLTPVSLSLYKPAQGSTSVMGMSIYHSGVVIYDTEYTYAQTGTNLSGIIAHRPTKQPQQQQSPWKFEKSVELGGTPCTREELKLILNELSSEWKGNQYDLTSKNCNHFSEALCTRLGVKFPSYVNRAAKMGNPFKSVVGTGGNAANNNTVYVGEDDIRPVTEHDRRALIHEQVENFELISAGFIEMSKIACLNEHKTNNSQAIFNAKNRIQQKYYLESDCDEQLMLFLSFVKPVKIVGFQVQLSLKHKENLPKIIHFYSNCDNINFDDVNNEVVKPTQIFELPSVDEIEEDSVGSLLKITRNPQSKQEKKQNLVSIHLPTKASSFSHVKNLVIFIKSNQSECDKTIIHGFDFFGRAADKK